MVTLVCGSRDLGMQDLYKALAQYKLPITEVVCGCARGIDRAGYEWAREHKIPVSFFPAWSDQHTWAFWAKLPGEKIHFPRGGYDGPVRIRGFQRNQAMAEYAQAAIVVWDSSSQGSKDMQERCRLREKAKRLKLFVYQPRLVQATLF